MYRIICAYAKKSSATYVHPIEKIVLAILPIIVLGFFNNITLILVNISIFLLVHIFSKNPAKLAFKFALGIALFAAISCITFVFDYGITYSLAIILKSFSGGLCLAYLALTTPLDDILYYASKIDALKDVCDIAKSMERFLVLIEDEYLLLHRAVKSRGGLDSLPLKIKNTGKIAGLLFVNTLKRWDEIKDAISSRCYKGYMSYMIKDFNFSKIRFIVILGYNIMLLGLNYVIGHLKI